MDTLFLNELILYNLLITGCSLDLLEQCLLSHLTRLTHHLFAVDIQDEGRDGLYLFLISEFLVLIYIKLKDLEIIRQAGIDVCYDGHHFLAMRAP